MTEEDRQLVLEAALRGAVFDYRSSDDGGEYWFAPCAGDEVGGGWSTRGRAANSWLKEMGFRTKAEFAEYERRTDGKHDTPADWAFELSEPDALRRSTEELNHATDRTKPTIRLAGPQPSEQQADA